MRFISMLILAVLCLAAPSGASQTALFSLTEMELGRMEEGKTHSFTLRMKNTSGRSLKIQMVVTSCGCALASPAETLVAENGELELHLTIDTRGKLGTFEKTVTITTDAGIHALVIRAESIHTSRASVVKTAIFSEPCSRCHSATNIDRRPVNELYASLCDVCHGRLEEFWKSKPGYSREALSGIITHGLENASMPGFANSAGGPLPDARVGELADYIIKAR